MLESKIEQRAVALVHKHLGIKGSKLNIIGDTGYPDRIFWVPGGKPLMIEFKTKTGKVSPKQTYIHKYLKDLGYKVEVHTDAVDAFEAVINSVDTTSLSKESLEILIGASRKCSLLRSRVGEDGDYPCSDQIPKEKEDGEEGSADSTVETPVRSMARRDKEMARLQWAEGGHSTRNQKE